MTDDAAFIRAIREAPEDETTRLVYADWLDDRGDPRGRYLRTEADWVGMHPDTPDRRATFIRLSELAGSVDASWLADVSRLAVLARQAWEPAAAAFLPHETERSTEPAREWVEAVGLLRATFAKYVGPEATARRFCVPADYAAFMTAVGGGWQQNNEWEEFYSARRVAEHTTGVARTFPDDPGEHLEIWVHIGIIGDHNEQMLCCDSASPRFGEVANAEDYHPWMGGSQPLGLMSRTFLEYVRENLAETGDPEP